MEFRIHFHLYTIIITNTYEIGTGLELRRFQMLFPARFLGDHVSSYRSRAHVNHISAY